ncbi:hypothetical protein niasHT_036809 [Heterodera trifolii]|uniref:BTB domain-containing protein n=1 Tax=Heterodera trifolii TaxID=157864 RepID=A0ABD2J1Q9_9BILA
MAKLVIDRMKLILSSGEDADVHFLVGEGDEKELLPAHKLILKNASDVFRAMFRFDAKKEIAENASANCPVVEVPDVEAAAFKVMLSFIYAGDLSGLNGDSAMAVLYAAKKYNIPDLVDRSLQIPFSELRNVFFASAQTRLFDLENYVSDCLDYIDKNADTLLKSDEFLQIDQKLLCEILEQNRRQMLGPALFKIRFPLVQKIEFSEKIVPFGVLTAEEVTGIVQYNIPQNFCGISGGILYPLQFPCHGRISPHGTIVMDIEKFFEFAEESHRFSKTLQIMGFAWRISAEIRRNKKNTETVLGFYLLCEAPKEDPNLCCVCSATFRIVPQKNGAYLNKAGVWHAVDNNLENATGTLCDRFVNNNKNWLGFNNFISFAELVNPRNGFYNSGEDRVTLAIDLSVKKEKTDKFFSDPCQSNGTISMEIEKVSGFAREIIGSERKSEAVHIKGFSLRILAQISPKNGSTGNEKLLGIYLLCDSPTEENWSFKCSAIIRIVSQKCGVADLQTKINVHIRNNEHNGRGFRNFITFAELLDPRKGFYNREEDKVTLAIDVTVK